MNSNSNPKTPQRRAHINQQRSSYFFKTYRIAFRHYRKLFIKQRRRCAICQKKAIDVHFNEDSPKLELHVDHCHATGKVRGLLCQNCNVGLGCFKDDQQLFLAAIEYLKTTSVESYSPFEGILMKKKYKARVKIG